MERTERIVYGLKSEKVSQFPSMLIQAGSRGATTDNFFRGVFIYH